MNLGPDYIFEKNAALFQQGSEEALAFFFTQFHPALSHYAFALLKNRFIAEEIAAGAFVKTWKMHRKLDRYEGIRAYLYKVVNRDCLRAIEKEKKRFAVHLSASGKINTDDSPFDQLVKSELYRLLHNEIKKLSPGSQKVLTMHYFEGKTTAEIAAELQLSDSTVKTQKLRALATLRKRLNSHLPAMAVPFLKIFFQ